MDLISVIVPVYKVEPYLDRCVQSIVDQTYHNLEIILVDDGSPDNCGAMCDAWAAKDSRIKVIHKENGGLSDARNAGMAVATGKYIGFVDSDDWIHPEFFSLLHNGISKFSAEISACDVTISDAYIAPATFDAPSYTQYSAEQALQTLIQGKVFRATAWNKLYRRELLQRELFPVGKFHEDEFLTYRILGKAKMLCHVDVPLYHYFQRPGSIMHSLDIRHIDTLDAYRERLNYLEKNYRNLYLQDRSTFCISCVNLYIEALSLPSNEFSIAADRIITHRSQLNISFREMLRYPFRDSLYMIGSHINMDLFCRLLAWKRGPQT